MVQLALIGCGIMGSTHQQLFDRLSQRLKVVATVDIHLERAWQAQQFLGATRAATDFRDELSEVDAVLIARLQQRTWSVGCPFETHVDGSRWAESDGLMHGSPSLTLRVRWFLAKCSLYISICYSRRCNARTYFWKS